MPRGSSINIQRPPYKNIETYLILGRCGRSPSPAVIPYLNTLTPGVPPNPNLLNLSYNVKVEVDEICTT